MLLAVVLAKTVRRILGMTPFDRLISNLQYAFGISVYHSPVIELSGNSKLVFGVAVQPRWDTDVFRIGLGNSASVTCMCRGK